MPTVRRIRRCVWCQTPFEVALRQQNRRYCRKDCYNEAQARQHGLRRNERRDDLNDISDAEIERRHRAALDHIRRTGQFRVDPFARKPGNPFGDSGIE